MSDWQPIETAPKDGTRFVGLQLSDDGPRYTVCFLNTFQDEEFWQFGGIREHPDYWLPLSALPAPPEVSHA